MTDKPNYTQLAQTSYQTAWKETGNFVKNASIVALAAAFIYETQNPVGFLVGGIFSHLTVKNAFSAAANISNGRHFTKMDRLLKETPEERAKKAEKQAKRREKLEPIIQRFYQAASAIATTASVGASIVTTAVPEFSTVAMLGSYAATLVTGAALWDANARISVRNERIEREKNPDYYTQDRPIYTPPTWYKI